MRRTALGILAHTAAWASLGTALVLGAWGPAVGAFAAIAVLAGTRRGLLPPDAHVERDVPSTARQGEVVRVRIEARHGGPGVLLVESPPPTGFTLLRETVATQRGTTVVEQDLQAVTVGHHAWAPIRLEATDAWGLQAQRRDAEAPAATTVTPDLHWAIRGRRLGLRNPVQATVRALLASERSLELASVRPYDAGDKLRDIDWKATSRLGEMQVRERERHMPRPVTVVLDCGISMRIQRADMKLLTAARIAHGVLAAASGAGTSSHLVAAQPAATVCQPVSGLADAERALTEVLASCPPVAPAQASGPGLAARPILAALPEAPGLVVLVLDAEADPDLVIELLPLLKRRATVSLVIPASGAHLYRRHEARGPVLRALRRWRANRARVTRTANALGMPVHVAMPGDEADAIARLVRRLA